MKTLLTTLTRATAFVLVASSAVGAQSSAPPSTTGNTKVKTRQLAAPLATSTEVLGSLAAVRQLPNGNVLVNDQARHRVLLMDKLLNVVSVVADSTSNTGNAYGVRPGGLLAFRGDSTLFIDPASLSMLVIDPSGVIARTMAAPRPNDVNSLIGGAQGNPGFDAKGRLVYRAPFSFTRGAAAPGTPFTMPALPDSAALVRFDLATRKLDTAAFFKLPKVRINTIPDDNGGIKGMTITNNPLPVVDDWAVLTDGTIAVVRGQDYHVDLIDASGTIRKSDKVPYDWQRMTDEDKQNFLDSTRVAMEKQRAANLAAAAPDKPAGGAAAPGGAGDKVAAAAAGAGDGMVVRMQVGGGGSPPPGGGGQQVMTFGGPGGNAALPPISLVSASELPDYKPVFGPGAIRSDMDGHLWIRTIATRPGGPIYEVLDSNGKLVDRVQIPVGTTIAGFGEGGVVYLGFKDAAGIHVQRALSK